MQTAIQRASTPTQIGQPRSSRLTDGSIPHAARRAVAAHDLSSIGASIVFVPTIFSISPCSFPDEDSVTHWIL